MGHLKCRERAILANDVIFLSIPMKNIAQELLSQIYRFWGRAWAGFNMSDAPVGPLGAPLEMLLSLLRHGMDPNDAKNKNEPFRFERISYIMHAHASIACHDLHLAFLICYLIVSLASLVTVYLDR